LIKKDFPHLELLTKTIASIFGSMACSRRLSKPIPAPFAASAPISAFHLSRDTFLRRFVSSVVNTGGSRSPVDRSVPADVIGLQRFQLFGNAFVEVADGHAQLLAAGVDVSG